ncbi:DUF3052 domain-containing protein [Bacillus sp. Marseille-P3661]|uniref:DUF3052 domain-containing protein n=1 Tax=Bacillus sp. Marseille-P3661 TaxID=1936234 RepID=UPI000C83E548|nr:DUF3052 domain-containing protein [Bacillus sp. Marseille-P3661]
MNPVIKKLQLKDESKPVLILNAPVEYNDILAAFQAEVHKEVINDQYQFVQVFGTANEELKMWSKKGAEVLVEDGLLWLCYPKKTSKKYKGSDCSRDSVTGILADEGFEPVRQVAIDDDWSALRYRKVEHIKKMTRNFAVTEKGKERTE